MNERNIRSTFNGSRLTIAALFLCVLGLLQGVSGCATMRNGPQTIEQLDAMSDAEYDRFASKVETRCDLIGQAAIHYGADPKKFGQFCGSLAAVTDSTGNPFLSAAEAVGLDDALVKLLLLDIEEALGDLSRLTGSGRSLDLVHRIAGALFHGAVTEAARLVPVDHPPPSSPPAVESTASSPA